jgi:hypothetical protein
LDAADRAAAPEAAAAAAAEGRAAPPHTVRSMREGEAMKPPPELGGLLPTAPDAAIPRSSREGETVCALLAPAPAAALRADGAAANARAHELGLCRGAEMLPTPPAPAAAAAEAADKWEDDWAGDRTGPGGAGLGTESNTGSLPRNIRSESIEWELGVIALPPLLLPALALPPIPTPPLPLALALALPRGVSAEPRAAATACNCAGLWFCICDW